MRALYSLEVKWREGEPWEFVCAFKSLRAARRDADAYVSMSGVWASRVQRWTLLALVGKRGGR